MYRLKNDENQFELFHAELLVDFGINKWLQTNKFSFQIFSHHH